MAEKSSFQKHFNSTTNVGRANVAKATYASIALIYIFYRLRRKPPQPKPKPIQNEQIAKATAASEVKDEPIKYAGEPVAIEPGEIYKRGIDPFNDGSAARGPSSQNTTCETPPEYMQPVPPGTNTKIESASFNPSLKALYGRDIPTYHAKTTEERKNDEPNILVREYMDHLGFCN